MTTKLNERITFHLIGCGWDIEENITSVTELEDGRTRVTAKYTNQWSKNSPTYITAYEYFYDYQTGKVKFQIFDESRFGRKEDRKETF